jgi:chromate transporter
MHPTMEPAQASDAAPPAVGFWRAFLFWLKLGFISFGGPAGQIAIMHQELVEKRRWLSESRFLHALNYCMLLPGPEAQQLAIYIGWLMHRTWGGIVAGVLFVLPSLIILIALSWFYLAHGDLPWVAGLLYGIKPAVVAIVLLAVHRMASRTLRNVWMWAIAAAAFLAIFAVHVPFPAVVLVAALVGLLGARIAPERFKLAGAHGKTTRTFGPALIDDHSPTPAHARFTWPRLVTIALVGALLWVLPMAFVTWAGGWDHTLAQMGWFFTKAALLTFGGAYAVLPYVQQGAVVHFGWLTPTQMIDGLALGESTPGPLIMVVAFVAFLGGHGQALFGPEALFWSGAVAACWVTWFTFLPSFLFILAGGPWVESSHGRIAFTAPLTAITAAVVGVVLNLALFFGQHVLWPAGLAGAFDPVAALLVLAATIALFRYKLNVIAVIAASALVGMLIQLFKL